MSPSCSKLVFSFCLNCFFSPFFHHLCSSFLLSSSVQAEAGTVRSLSNRSFDPLRITITNERPPRTNLNHAFIRVLCIQVQNETRLCCLAGANFQLDEYKRVRQRLDETTVGIFIISFFPATSLHRIY